LQLGIPAPSSFDSSTTSSDPPNAPKQINNISGQDESLLQWLQEDSESNFSYSSRSDPIVSRNVFPFDIASASSREDQIREQGMQPSTYFHPIPPNLQGNSDAAKMLASKHNSARLSYILQDRNLEELENITLELRPLSITDVNVDLEQFMRNQRKLHGEPRAVTDSYQSNVRNSSTLPFFE
jgi:hypothetical protein